MRATARYCGEEIEVDFSGTMEPNDLGVPRSPRWLELDPSSVEIEALSILGVDVDPKAVPSDLVNAIHELSSEVEFEAESVCA